MQQPYDMELYQQIVIFLNLLLNFTNTSSILHTVLESHNLEIVLISPLNILLKDKYFKDVPEQERKKCHDYVLNTLTQFKQRYLNRNNYNPSILELKNKAIKLITKWNSKTKDEDSNLEESDIEDSSKFESSRKDIPLSELSLPTLGKNKTNKEQGLIQFISLCQEIKNITSSVDMYSNYRRWCLHHGYGYYSSPTLTKYLRASDKRLLESVSDKMRSQGWYLQTPDV